MVMTSAERARLWEARHPTEYRNKRREWDKAYRERLKTRALAIREAVNKEMKGE